MGGGPTTAKPTLGREVSIHGSSWAAVTAISFQDLLDLRAKADPATLRVVDHESDKAQSLGLFVTDAGCQLWLGSALIAESKR